MPALPVAARSFRNGTRIIALWHSELSFDVGWVGALMRNVYHSLAIGVLYR